MLIPAKNLKGYTLLSRDGEIGSVREFYFDDQHWTIRYLVADTAGWLTGRQVLLSPYALGTVEPEGKDIVVDLTRKQIEDSPSLDTDKPVSRQFEQSYAGYYGMPMYWGGMYSWGAYSYPVRDRTKWNSHAPGKEAGDAHLRSTRDVTGRHIQASDGEIGHVEDFIIDSESWAIRYLIVSTLNWWPGKKVLISPRWIDRVDWSESKVFVGLSRAAIQKSPAYNESALLNRDYESHLHLHYNRPGYWNSENSLVSSPAMAEREVVGLHRGQTARDSAPAAGEGDIRSSVT
ncbi:MAG: PRC-barrel domain-containing protein [Opitutaceae bacterium]